MPLVPGRASQVAAKSVPTGGLRVHAERHARVRVAKLGLHVRHVLRRREATMTKLRRSACGLRSSGRSGARAHEPRVRALDGHQEHALAQVVAVLRRSGASWAVEQVADGFTPDEVIALTELDVSGVPTPA